VMIAPLSDPFIAPGVQKKDLGRERRTAREAAHDLVPTALRITA
jgi:hypothetical protein